HTLHSLSYYVSLHSPLCSHPLFSPCVSSQRTPPPPIFTLSLHDALPISNPDLFRQHKNAVLRRCSIAVTDPLVKPGKGYCRPRGDRKSTRLNSSHGSISYAVFCMKNKRKNSTSGCHSGPAPRPRTVPAYL